MYYHSNIQLGIIYLSISPVYTCTIHVCYVYMYKYYLSLLSPTDTDECITGEHICHEFSTCENAVGFFSCSCNDGFRGDGVDCESKY